MDTVKEFFLNVFSLIVVRATVPTVSASVALVALIFYRVWMIWKIVQLVPWNQIRREGVRDMKKRVAVFVFFLRSSVLSLLFFFSG